MLLLVLVVSVGTFGTPVNNRELCTPKDLDSAMRNFAWTLISKSFPKGSMNMVSGQNLGNQNGGGHYSGGQNGERTK